MKISQCGDGSLLAYSMMAPIAPSLSREKLCDFQ
jgi:hypothetical protein